jgi:hypothetical protein
VAQGIVETTQQGAETAGQGSTRSKLVQRLLTGSANLPQFVNDLLTTQAVLVAGTEAAGFVVEKKEEGMNLRPIAHIRPDNSSAETRAAAIAAFQDLLKPCIAQGKDGAIEINAGDVVAEPQFCLVTLLRNEGEVVAASAVITRCRNLERAQQRLVSMQLVAGYFELFTLRRTSEQSQIIAQSHQHVLQLATAVATAEGFESAAMNLCNELATRTGASRVTLGWIKGHDIRVKAFSHTEQFDKKQDLIVQLEKTMEECVDQEEPVYFDPEGGGSENVSRAAQALSRSQGSNVVLSLPLRRTADVVGVVTLEFPAGHKLSTQASTGLSVAVDLLAPQLYDRYQNDRWLITKAGLSTKEFGKKVLGPQHMLSKLLVVLLIAAGIFISVYKPMYHVSAPFQFASLNQRKLDAPFDGYIDKVFVRPGDHVKAGAALLKMDTSDTELELNKSQADADAELAEAQKAANDPTKQADRQVALDRRAASLADVARLKAQIARGTIVAPFDCEILKGDLKDQVHSAKKEGEELFTVSGDDSLRAELSVSERDIQYLKDGKNAQKGMLATTTLPTQRYKFTIDRIIPVGEPKDGDNVFTVYATLEEKSPTWRAGMQGEARINIENKPLAWIWTHKLIDYVRMRLWI